MPTFKRQRRRCSDSRAASSRTKTLLRPRPSVTEARMPIETAEPAPRWRRTARKALIGAATLLALATGIVGFAHTRAGRPLLAWLSGAPGCPVNHGQADPASIDAFRVQQLARRTGRVQARSHRARSFELG